MMRGSLNSSMKDLWSAKNARRRADLKRLVKVPVAVYKTGRFTICAGRRVLRSDLHEATSALCCSADFLTCLPVSSHLRTFTRNNVISFLNHCSVDSLGAAMYLVLAWRQGLLPHQRHHRSRRP
jgi:hypothetical protein